MLIFRDSFLSCPMIFPHLVKSYCLKAKAYIFRIHPSCWDSSLLLGRWRSMFLRVHSPAHKRDSAAHKKFRAVASSSPLMEKESFQVWSRRGTFENGASAKAQPWREKAVGSNLSTWWMSPRWWAGSNEPGCVWVHCPLSDCDRNRISPIPLGASDVFRNEVQGKEQLLLYAILS